MIRSVCLALCTIVICAAAVQASEPAELQELREQRVVVAEKKLDLAREFYAAGKLPVEQVLVAQSQLAGAKYEAATTAAARIEACEQAVKIAEELWDQAKRRNAAGVGTQLEALQAEYALLTAKLRLAEEKQKAAAR